MIPFRHIVSAAVVAAGLQLSPVAAQAPSPDVAYHAPSWWITAVIEGKLDTLRTGTADLDRRMSAWVVGFGQGLAAHCGLGEGRGQPTANTGAGNLAQRGASDGKRFAEINGCSSTDAQAARRTIASAGNLVTADATDRRNTDRSDVDRREPERRDTERRDTDRRETDRGEVSVAREAIVVNRSGTRIDVVNMSETTDRDWGVDRLGNDVLDHGNGVRVPLRGSRSCFYDVRVTYSNGRVEERRNVNLCTSAQVIFDGSATRGDRRGWDGQASAQDNPNRRPSR